uniref:Uncharacterized protein n=1 Tax=Meloidogyne enterolobii TaxID=390850 RepID=A0A6V7Y8A4_MELEN|nr:unnamed protein product [Meloidogyne enterolobii]
MRKDIVKVPPTHQEVPPVREIQVPVMDTEEKPKEIELERRNTRKKKRWY